MPKPESQDRGPSKPRPSPSHHHDREDTRQEREKSYVKQTEQQEQRSGPKGQQQ